VERAFGFGSDLPKKTNTEGTDRLPGQRSS
jgi:hypothetical protein